MSKYKCIIFDCDGVLVDSEPIGNQVLVEMTNELGANINLDYAYQHFKGNSLHKCMRHISEIINTSLPKNFETEYRQRSFAAFKKDIKPIEGVKEVIKNLNIPFCVASSGPHNKIELNLKLTGLLPFFKNNIFSCYAIQKWKPNPEVFLWASKTMGFKPNDCLVIEDSLIGITAALNGGFDVFGYSAQDYGDKLKNKATETFDSMTKLPDLIEYSL